MKIESLRDWWADIVADINEDSATLSLHMSHHMAQQTLEALDSYLRILEADDQLVEEVKSVIGSTFVEQMGWGESKPFAALEAYAIADAQARAVLARLGGTDE